MLYTDLYRSGIHRWMTLSAQCKKNRRNPILLARVMSVYYYIFYIIRGVRIVLLPTGDKDNMKNKKSKIV